MSSARVPETEPLLIQCNRTDAGDEEASLDQHATPDDVNKVDWKFELSYIASNSVKLAITYLLQYFGITLIILVVSHLGRDELASVSLGIITTNVVGFALFEGVATGLDTLCSQAYGAGKLSHVGLHCQRMVLFLILLCVPISGLWICSPWFLNAVVPQKHLVPLAASFLRVSVLGLPGFAVFEAAKRFVQAQSDFTATFVVSAVGAPINLLLQWFFVYKLHWGVAGAAAAHAILNTIRPMLLVAYIYLIAPKTLQCWQRPSTEMFRDWAPMIWLSIPGAVINICEWGAFEILVFSTSYLGTAELAAQTLLVTAGGLLWHIPFSAGIAVSTRIGNLIGAEAVGLARKLPRLYAPWFLVTGLCEMALLLVFKRVIAKSFTSDDQVARIVRELMPIVAIFVIFDGTICCCHGILRALGRQSIGSWLAVIGNYAYMVPLALYLELGEPHLGLRGVWFAIMSTMIFTTLIESIILKVIDWQKCVDEAKKREGDLAIP